MATILHVYPNPAAAEGAFRSSNIPGRRDGIRRRIHKPDGDFVKFAVVTRKEDVKYFHGLDLAEIYWHHQPVPELEMALMALMRVRAE